MQEGQPSAWTVYLASDDVDATAKLIGEHGGTIYAGPMDISGNGRMLIAADPTCGVFGVWQQTGMIGSELVDEPGAFVWDDARLKDVEAGKRFYADVFGFHYSPLGPEAGDTGGRIVAEVWGRSWPGANRTLDVHVATLRTKLGRPELVATVRGVGYRLGVPDGQTGTTPPAE